MTEDRGQLLLVAAVLIALVVVASAVLLNGLVTPESATTSSLSTDAKTFERTSHSLENDLESLFEHNTSVDEAGEPLPYADSDALGRAVNGTYAPLVANGTFNRTGAVLDVRYARASTLTGDVVYDQTGREFENESGNGDWTVAEGVETIPRATFVIDDEYATNRPDAFTIAVDGAAGGPWEIAVTNDAVYVGSSGTPRCDGAIDPGSAEQIRLDVRNPAIHNATLEVIDPDGEVRCSRRVQFGDGVSGPTRTISIENGGEATGTYVVSVDDGVHGNARTGPWATVRDDVVVNPAFAVTYLTDGIEYESTYRLYNVSR